MRIAVLSESLADEAAVVILVAHILGQPVDRVPGPPLRSRGWPSVWQLVPTVLRALHYRSDAEGLAVVVDSDESPVHRPGEDQATAAANGCRLCQVRRTVDKAQRDLADVPGRSRMKTAIGVTVPAIEAWYRCGLDGTVTETAWIQALQAGHRPPYTKNGLKRAVYGTDRPSRELEERRAVEEADRLVASGLVSRLEIDFPNTFGSMVRDLRSWTTP